MMDQAVDDLCLAIVASAYQLALIHLFAWLTNLNVYITRSFQWAGRPPWKKNSPYRDVRAANR